MIGSPRPNPALPRRGRMPPPLSVIQTRNSASVTLASIDTPAPRSRPCWIALLAASETANQQAGPDLHVRHRVLVREITQICVHLRYVCYNCRMPRDEEITFADHLGRFYARRYAFPPMVGRVLGYLLVCEPPDQTIAELSEALLASRSAITGALDVLERLHAIRRSRAAGERMDRVRVDFSSAEARGFDVTEYQELGDLAREGLEVLRRSAAERQADAARDGRVRRLPGRADPPDAKGVGGAP